MQFITLWHWHGVLDNNIFYFICIAGPTNIGHHQFRTININQRPLLEPPYLRDLESFRRKTALSQISSNNNTNNISSNTNSNASIEQCQGYKPNAPQIQGEFHNGKFASIFWIICASTWGSNHDYGQKVTII